mgnify:CR=1 FL=1
MRLPVPVVLLLGVLQRAPMWQTVANPGTRMAAPAVAMVRSALTLAAMGTYQALAGATQLAGNPASPASAKVGVAFSAGFAVTGSPAAAASYEVRGQIPPGIAVAEIEGDLVNASAVSLSGTPTAAGTYVLTIRAWNAPNKQGEGGLSFTYTIIVAAADPVVDGPSVSRPVVVTQPESATVAPGGSLVLRVGATGSGTVTFQWRKNGVQIAGAIGNRLSLNAVTSADSADYTVAVTDSNGTTISAAATVLVATPEPGRLVNLAVRSRAGSGAKTLIAGFVTSGGGGTGGLRLRALGPALSAFGVPGVLADPKLEVFSGSTVIASNGNVSAEEAASFGLSAGALDAALVATLSAGAYTAQVTGADGGEGVALIEVNDANPSVNDAAVPSLINVAARTEVGTGADILIAGFTISGNVPKRILIRALGPRLSDFGVTGVLADPQVKVFREDLLVAANDNVSDLDASAADLSAGAKDAALVVGLPAGAYTAQVSGVGETSGVALVEVNDLQ